eukprot:gnl/Hemi2/23761_TR7976_c0_g6_i1.p1 gnl/Hemi2/23761_TR7976_c0_g6~~gnl/Hemi2/23761_TR7976_c0_g6_i1.p1  ORF type:complete len:240 (+),score=8.40 gnl/Hemi2/23761_TR7976_c0_g6_i1:276-995(+)
MQPLISELCSFNSTIPLVRYLDELWIAEGLLPCDPARLGLMRRCPRLRKVDVELEPTSSKLYMLLTSLAGETLPTSVTLYQNADMQSSPVRLQIFLQTGDAAAPQQHIVTVSRSGSDFGYGELLCKIAHALHCPVEVVGDCGVALSCVDGGDWVSTMSTALEMSLFRDWDRVSVQLLAEPRPSRVVDSRLPALTYAEYVALHPTPDWTGFYVFGCGKASEDDDEVIQALLNSDAIRPFL